MASPVPDLARIDTARAQYFRDHGLGPDGGYSARWVRFRVGPLVIPFPNSTARVAALPLHDLHHIATGYDTSWTGEAEIAAWELGAGCGRYLAAWLLNLAALPIGLVIAPRRTWRAFRRGRSTRTLYDEAWDPAWLGRTVGSLRERLDLGHEPENVRPGDVLRFAACVVPGAAVLLVLVLILGAL
jgi:hypothetical protein